MKIKLLKPLYLDSVVVMDGTITERDEAHARELIARGYAELVEESNTSESDNVMPSNEEAPEMTETKGKRVRSNHD